MKIIRKSETYNTYDFNKITKVKKSRYNICKKYNEGYLLVNTNSNAIVFLNEDEFDRYEGLKVLSIEFDCNLLSLGIVVPHNSDELEEIKENIRRSSRNSQNADIFTIYPTQKCNANCEYCFEKNEEKIEMSTEVERGVIEYLKQNINRDHRTIIRWFGGEPLLASSIIDNISIQLKAVGCQFNAMITTNAIMLNPILIKKAKEDWNITSVHLTVDGYREEHSKRKGIARGDEYVRLLDNIKFLLENNIAVVCRINLDKNNENQLDFIINDMARFSGENNFLIDVAPLRGVGKQYFRETEYGELYANAHKKLCAANLIHNVYDVIPKRLHENCVACVNNSVVINAKGNLFKCTLHSTSEDNKLGTIYTGITTEDKMWLNTTIREECEQCKLLPVCFGGCKEFANNISSKGAPCRKIKYHLEESMRQLYQYYCRFDRRCI